MPEAGNDGSRSARLAHHRIGRAQERRRLRIIATTIKELRAARVSASRDESKPEGAGSETRPWDTTPAPRWQPARPWGANCKAFERATSPTKRHRPGTSSAALPAAQSELKCKACGGALSNEFSVMLQRTVRARDGSVWHAHCFCCSVCDMLLCDNKSDNGLTKPYFVRDGHLFCESDFRDLHGKECSICSARLLSWNTRAGEAYCPSHEGKYPTCHGCSRLLPPSVRAAELSDGRFACQRCDATSVVHVEAAKVLWDRVRDFFVMQGLLHLPEASTLEFALLDQLQLTSQMQTHLAKGRKCCPLALTCTEQIEHRQTAQVLPDSRRVSSVLLITALPEDVALATLAHEAGHVYLHLNGFNTHMADRVAEGVCELFSYLWEQGQLDRGAKDEGERQRRMAAMHTSTDEVYGAGFRDALAAYKQCGSSLVAFLARVKESGGQLPRANGPQVAIWARQGGRAWQSRGGTFQPASEDVARIDTWRRARAFDGARRDMLERKGRAAAHAATHAVTRGLSDQTPHKAIGSTRMSLSRSNGGAVAQAQASEVNICMPCRARTS